MCIYTKEEKAARQEADAEQEAKEQSKELSSGASSKASQYVPGRYYGGGKSGSGPRTQVNKINSANLKSASGSGISGTFGPKGDFSNFRSQNKGNDQFTPQAKGKMNARQALFQTAKGSRAAAGLKNDKLLNAKKAMMGGDIKGGDAFMSDSGAVDLSKAAGLELDTNAPVSSADLSGLDDALNEANDDAADDAADAEETEWWQEMLQDLAKQAVQGLLTMGMNATQDAIAQAKQDKAIRSASYLETMADVNAQYANFDAQQAAYNEFTSNPDAWRGAHPNMDPPTPPTPPSVPRPPAMDSTGISANDLARLQGNPAAAKKVGLEYKNGQWQNRSDHSAITLDANGGISGETLNGLGRKNLGSDLAKANGMLQQDYFQNNQIFQNNAKRDVANYHANNPANSQPMTQEDTRRRMCTTGTTTYMYAGKQYNCQ